jgi:hypothetical protein
MLLLGLSATGCRRGTGSMTREQQNYDVVQEGAPTGTSTTVGAPGETATVPVAMTNTNADTTTNFMIAPPVGSTTATAPGTIASTLPATSTSYSQPPANGEMRAPRRPPPRSGTTSRPPISTTTSDQSTATSTDSDSATATSTTSTTPPPPSERSRQRRPDGREMNPPSPAPTPVPQPPSEEQPATQTGTIGPG